MIIILYSGARRKPFCCCRLLFGRGAFSGDANVLAEREALTRLSAEASSRRSSSPCATSSVAVGPVDHVRFEWELSELEEWEPER